MFKPVPTSVHDILNSTSQFTIPLYQREYKWGEEEATELIEDLKSYEDARGDFLFLGNLIFESTKDNKSRVVDGQQRLTTIILLLVACRSLAKKLGNVPLATKIQDKITFTDSTTSESLGPRLIASESVREVFEHITKENWDGIFPAVIEKSGKKQQVKRQVNRLKPIYDYFLHELSDFKQTDLSKFLGAIYKSYVIRIDIENEEEALSLFERTNARGLDLEISDLLKNHLFSQKVKGIEDVWKLILENSSGTILRMLKYFYVTKRGYVLKPQLYKKLKGYSAEVGPEEMTRQLSDFSKFYRVAKVPGQALVKAYFEDLEFSEIVADAYRYEKMNRALEALREFNVVQFCPPAFAAIECLARNGGQGKAGDAKKLIQLFETFEKYHFINNAICERVGNEIEKLYADACLWYADSNNFIQTTDKLINELKLKLAKEDEFIASFSNLTYSQDQTSLICYIFDRFNNIGLEPGQCIPIYNPDMRLRRRNHNIEHFFSQKPDTNAKVKKSDAEFVDNIGNLLVIYFKDNSSLGNASPSEKIKRLKGDLSQKVQNLKYVSEFIENYGPLASSWDAEKIKNRAKDMAVKGYREVWKIN
jgi:hypothetical protein